VFVDVHVDLVEGRRRNQVCEQHSVPVRQQSDLDHQPRLFLVAGFDVAALQLLLNDSTVVDDPSEQRRVEDVR
jgi:hypothetical protein